MVNIFQPNIVNRMVACLTIAAFSITAIEPPHLQAAGINLDLGAINFGIKVEKIFKKIKKAIDKGETNKIIHYMFGIKKEVEQYTGKKIDISKQIDEVQKQAKAKGQKIDERYIKQLKKEFERYNKKRKHRAVWFAQCVELGIPYTSCEADVHFDMHYAAKDNDKDIDVPITVTVGVSLSLCGLFLIFVPIPICNTCGIYLLDTGIGILGSHALDKWDDYNQKTKK